jgi:alkylated DNA repair dioxygenase AlkB
VQTPDLHVDEPDLRLDLFAHAFAAPEAAVLFEHLRTEIHWEEKQIRLFGKTITSPRLSGWYGDPGVTYRYSGLTLEASGWTPSLLVVKARAEALSGATFNAVLCNLYRDGRDSMGFHSDAEAELGPDPVIASASFGEPRRFVLQPRRSKSRGVRDLMLGSGSILVLGGTTQKHWRHGLPKAPGVAGERINLTFRRIVGSAA